MMTPPHERGVNRRWDIPGGVISERRSRALVNSNFVGRVSWNHPSAQEGKCHIYMMRAARGALRPPVSYS